LIRKYELYNTLKQLFHSFSTIPSFGDAHAHISTLPESLILTQQSNLEDTELCDQLCRAFNPSSLTRTERSIPSGAMYTSFKPTPLLLETLSFVRQEAQFFTPHFPPALPSVQNTIAETLPA